MKFKLNSNSVLEAIADAYIYYTPTLHKTKSTYKDFYT